MKLGTIMIAALMRATPIAIHMYFDFDMFTSLKMRYAGQGSSALRFKTKSQID